jgi:hypothetical protein
MQRLIAFTLLTGLLSVFALSTLLSPPVAVAHDATVPPIADVLRTPYEWQASQPAIVMADILRSPYQWDSTALLPIAESSD